jgi:hypothetical protein
MEAIREYEMSLSRELVRVLSKSGAKIYGASAPEKTDQRTLLFASILPVSIPTGL